MSLTDRSGRELNSRDLQVLKNMLRGSLENRIRWWNQVQVTGQFKEQTSQMRKAMVGIYRDYSKCLSHIINRWQKMSQNHTVSEFISQFSNILSWSLAKYCTMSKKSLSLHIYQNFVDNLKINSGGPALMKEFGLRLLSKDSDEGYQQTIKQLSFATKPFEGVEMLGNYQINQADIQALYHGTANPLVQEINWCERQRANGCDPVSYSRRIAELNRHLDAQLRIANCAWQGVATLKREAQSRGLTFADLYTILSESNKIGRPNEPGAGSLCGAEASINDVGLFGVAPSVAPKVMINTLDLIAYHMNRIRKEPNAALRKTQAIQLAAFAESMVVSMQAFEDGNKRSARVIRDTILMFFDLPPCMPGYSGMMPQTIGTYPVNFEKHASDVLSSIRLCDRELRIIKKMPVSKLILPILDIDGISTHSSSCIVDCTEQKGSFGDFAQQVPVEQIAPLSYRQQVPFEYQGSLNYINQSFGTNTLNYSIH